MNVLAIKHAVRERDRFCCTLCGMANDEHLALYGSQLQVHRRIPRSVYSIPGCYTVCIPCHAPLPKAPPGTPDPYHSGLPLYAYIPVQLREALDRQVCKTRRSITAEVQIALERYLQAEGEWPPATGQ